MRKFDQLLDATEALIVETGGHDFSLTDIAEKAGVATGSAYHFFASADAALVALMSRYDDVFVNIVTWPEKPVEGLAWQGVIERHFEESRRFMNEHPTAMDLFIGPGRTVELREIGALGDLNIAKAMAETLNRLWYVPTTPPPEQLLHMGIQILNGLWELSIQLHGEITDEFSKETTRAVSAYLRQYWPERFEPRPQTKTGTGTHVPVPGGP